MRTVFFNIRDGQSSNVKLITEAFNLPDGSYELKITKRSKRSLNQNRYYWGICVKMVHDGLKDLGHEVTLEETHDFLKAKFNYNEIVNESTGEVVSIPKSTTELSKTDFMEYIEKIQRFAAEFLNVVIPDPNTQLSIAV